MHEYWLDIGKIDNYKKAQKELIHLKDGGWVLKKLNKNDIFYWFTHLYEDSFSYNYHKEPKIPR
jgi:NDP-sugar pyrophosphorylase family protein